VSRRTNDSTRDDTKNTVRVNTKTFRPGFDCPETEFCFKNRILVGEPEVALDPDLPEELTCPEDL
jgi:hypothetical protein